MTHSRLKFSAAPGRTVALFEGHEIADSDKALVLKEGDYPPVVYFPREDVELGVLRRTDHTSRCPFKGEASYFTLYRDARVVENAAWSYEDPIEGVELIRDHIAFYPQHVEIRHEGGEAAPHVPPHDPPYADTTDPRDV
ncbi:MAG: DUF427 domain-containing protein [Caulobacter sp.]|nr:DUF427 domain-containing protein [Caulobacter sp.]